MSTAEAKGSIVEYLRQMHQNCLCLCMCSVSFRFISWPDLFHVALHEIQDDSRQVLVNSDKICDPISLIALPSGDTLLPPPTFLWGILLIEGTIRWKLLNSFCY